MIRTSKHSLKYLTHKKTNILSGFFDEYQRVVNIFIKIFWEADNIPKLINSDTYKQVDSWMLGKAMRCAGKQASEIVRSTLQANAKENYKVYKRVYSKLLKKNKQCNLTNMKWSEWIKTVKLRRRLSMPVFNGNTIELNSNISSVFVNTRITFDLLVSVASIFGNRFSLKMPTRQHKQNKKLIEQGFQLKQSIRLARYNDNYYINLYWEKETLPTKTQGKTIGIDLGLNKLLSLSDGSFIGPNVKVLIQKLNRRKRESKAYYRTLEELKSYISKCVKEVDLTDVKTVVVENLKGITLSTRKRTNKGLRKLLGHWNINLLHRRLHSLCELNRIEVALVNPMYTSQTCSSCGSTDQESRKGEVYNCTHCGYAGDADTNGARNILHLYLNRERTVPCEQETCKVKNW